MRFTILIFFFTMLISENIYKEPSFTLLEKSNNIEIRQYNEYIVARTAVPLSERTSENNMFRVLASYIFGKNQKQQQIPMTAPVTTFKNNESYDMLFYMLNTDDIENLPKPINQNISFEKINLDKCVSISFSWFTNDFKIKQYERKLKRFLKNNGYTQISPFMLNRYDSPWTFPWNRRNEILVKIK